MSLFGGNKLFLFDIRNLFLITKISQCSFNGYATLYLLCYNFSCTAVKKRMRQ